MAPALWTGCPERRGVSRCWAGTTESISSARWARVTDVTPRITRPRTSSTRIPSETRWATASSTMASTRGDARRRCCPRQQLQCAGHLGDRERGDRWRRAGSGPPRSRAARRDRRTWAGGLEGGGWRAARRSGSRASGRAPPPVVAGPGGAVVDQPAPTLSGGGAGRGAAAGLAATRAAQAGSGVFGAMPRPERLIGFTAGRRARRLAPHPDRPPPGRGQAIEQPSGPSSGMRLWCRSPPAGRPRSWSPRGPAACRTRPRRARHGRGGRRGARPSRSTRGGDPRSKGRPGRGTGRRRRVRASIGAHRGVAPPRDLPQGPLPSTRSPPSKAYSSKRPSVPDQDDPDVTGYPG